MTLYFVQFMMMLHLCANR